MDKSQVIVDEIEAQLWRGEISAEQVFDQMKSLWQAATAHNTDAVIDECMNDVTQILQLISIYYAEKLPTYDARAGLSVICSNYPESLRNKLRPLKTNNESCDHDWVSTHNPPVIIGGEVCVKCLSVRAAQKKEG